MQLNVEVVDMDIFNVQMILCDGCTTCHADIQNVKFSFKLTIILKE